MAAAAAEAERRLAEETERRVALEAAYSERIEAGMDDPDAALAALEVSCAPMRSWGLLGCRCTASVHPQPTLLLHCPPFHN